MNFTFSERFICTFSFEDEFLMRNYCTLFWILLFYFATKDFIQLYSLGKAIFPSVHLIQSSQLWLISRVLEGEEKSHKARRWSRVGGVWHVLFFQSIQELTRSRMRRKSIPTIILFSLSHVRENDLCRGWCTRNLWRFHSYMIYNIAMIRRMDLVIQPERVQSI